MFDFPTSFGVSGQGISNGLFVRKESLGNVVIYSGYSDLDGFIVESCHRNMDNKGTFGVVSANHSEGDVIQTQNRKSAEKYFFSSIEPQFSQISHIVFLNLLDNPVNIKYSINYTKQTGYWLRNNVKIKIDIKTRYNLTDKFERGKAGII